MVHLNVRLMEKRTLPDLLAGELDALRKVIYCRIQNLRQIHYTLNNLIHIMCLFYSLRVFYIRCTWRVYKRCLLS